MPLLIWLAARNPKSLQPRIEFPLAASADKAAAKESSGPHFQRRGARAAQRAERAVADGAKTDNESPFQCRAQRDTPATDHARYAAQHIGDRRVMVAQAYRGALGEHDASR